MAEPTIAHGPAQLLSMTEEQWLDAVRIGIHTNGPAAVVVAVRRLMAEIGLQITDRRALSTALAEAREEIASSHAGYARLAAKMIMDVGGQVDRAEAVEARLAQVETENARLQAEIQSRPTWKQVSDAEAKRREAEARLAQVEAERDAAKAEVQRAVGIMVDLFGDPEDCEACIALWDTPCTIHQSAALMEFCHSHGVPNDDCDCAICRKRPASGDREGR